VVVESPGHGHQIVSELRNELSGFYQLVVVAVEFTQDETEIPVEFGGGVDPAFQFECCDQMGEFGVYMKSDCMVFRFFAVIFVFLYFGLGCCVDETIN